MKSFEGHKIAMEKIEFASKSIYVHRQAYIWHILSARQMSDDVKKKKKDYEA